MNAGPVGHEEPTPMGTPVPAGECPHCGGFLWITLRAHAPVGMPAGPGAQVPPPSGCCDCPLCGERIFVSIGRMAPVARPKRPGSTALVPKETTTKKMR